MDTDCAAAIIIAVALKRKKRLRSKKKEKRIWSKEWFLKRALLGQNELLKELEYTSEGDLQNYLRMGKETFEELFAKIEPLIIKQDTIMRQSIPARHRLALTLRFLASGNSYEDLKFLTAIAPQTIGKIVIETCEAIIKQLKDYIKLPEDENAWKREAYAFESSWNFPNCLGAIDGKHVNITQPPGSGSLYFNYKKNFSIMLLAIVNANYEFLMIDVGKNGRASDAGLFNQTTFFSALKNNKLNIPAPAPLPGGNVEMPFVFVSDDAFPLMENIMKPFSHYTLQKDQIIFNYRLSRARRIVENAFGILASRFRVLLKTINLSPKKATIIVMACCYLHNFLRRKKETLYVEGGFDSQQNETGVVTYADWHNEPQLLCSLNAGVIRNSTNKAKNIRNKFCEYFSSTGAVDWQEEIYEKTTVKK